VAGAFVQALLTGQSKTAGTSLVLSGSKTVTAGNTIFVAFASDDVGSGYSVADNLGNTYSVVEGPTVQSGAVKTTLWRAPITTGGTLTTITVSWTTNATAKAAVSGEFSGVGTLSTVGGGIASPANINCYSVYGKTVPANGLAVGAHGYETPTTDDIVCSGYSGTPQLTMVEVGQDGTTGSGAASNITAELGYAVGTTTDSTGFYLFGADNTSSSRANAGAGGVYNPVAAGETFANRSRLVSQAVQRSAVM